MIEFVTDIPFYNGVGDARGGGCPGWGMPGVQQTPQSITILDCPVQSP